MKGNRYVQTVVMGGSRSTAATLRRQPEEGETAPLLRGGDRAGLGLLQRDKETKPSPEVDFLDDLETGTKQADKYVKYITKAVEYWQKYGGAKPAGIAKAAENLKKITETLSSGLQKFTGLVGKAKTVAQFLTWVKALDSFADKSKALTLQNAEEWIQAAEELGSATQPLKKAAQQWLKRLALKGGEVASRAYAVLAVVSAYVEVGSAVAKLGLKNIKQYVERTHGVIEGVKDKYVIKPPPPESPEPWQSAAERREEAKANEEYAKRARKAAEKRKRLADAEKAFEAHFPKIYQRRCRANLMGQILKALRQPKKWDIGTEGASITGGGYGERKWWDCFLDSGGEDHFDERAKIMITPKLTRVSVEQAKTEIGNFKYVSPGCPFFRSLYDREHERFLKNGAGPRVKKKRKKK